MHRHRLQTIPPFQCSSPDALDPDRQRDLSHLRTNWRWQSIHIGNDRFESEANVWHSPTSDPPERAI
jgi:hypothetical protein